MNKLTAPVEPLVVRKYGNRRLYRTDQSSYVTLQALTDLVHEDVVFTVEDAKTGRDITSVILAQIILEQERVHEGSLYPATLLRQLIRTTDQSLARFAQEHLPRLLELHQASERQVSGRLDRAVVDAADTTSADVLTELRSVQRQLDTLLMDLEPIDDSSSR